MTSELHSSIFRSRLEHWLADREILSAATGLPETEAVSRAAKLLEALRPGAPSGYHSPLHLDEVEVLHAAVAVLIRTTEGKLGELTEDASRLFHFISSCEWPEEWLSERTELLAQSAFQAWRGALSTSDSPNEILWRKRYATVEAATAAGLAAENLMENGSASDVRMMPDLRDQPSDVLLSACLKLRARVESVPDHVVHRASVIYRDLKALGSRVMRPEEQEYLLGELSLAAAVASRIQARRLEASSWLDHAEIHFRRAPNRDSSLARVMYERLALQVDERLFDRVSRVSDDLVTRLEALGLQDEALKCRFLKATAWKETERYSEAVDAYERLMSESRAIGNERLAAIALVNLFQIHAFRGNTAAALEVASEVTPILVRIDNRVGVAKLQLGLGYLLRVRGDLAEAIDAYRTALSEFHAIGLHGDVAGTHLVLADLLMDHGQPAQAQREIQAALPIIEEFQLVSEGFVALSLLRESLRRRKVDRQALRTLNRYFETRRG